MGASPPSGGIGTPSTAPSNPQPAPSPQTTATPNATPKGTSQPPPAPPLPDPISAPDLMKLNLPPLVWVVSGLLPEGVTILAGKPKAGKSFLALDIAISVAAGRPVLGTMPVNAGGVLYLGLEDSKRRLRDRLTEVLDGHLPPPNLFFETWWPLLDPFNGIKLLEEWLSKHPGTRLVVVDIFAKARRPSKSNANTYAEDYAATAPLTELVEKHHIALVLVVHLRKMPGDDPLDEVGGSVGVTGAVDTILVMKRSRVGAGDRAQLFLVGKDVEQETLALQSTAGSKRWVTAGGSAAANISPERQAILDLLSLTGVPLSPADISRNLRKNSNAIRQLLSSMLNDGQVRQPTQGFYTI